MTQIKFPQDLGSAHALSLVLRATTLDLTRRIPIALGPDARDRIGTGRSGFDILQEPFGGDLAAKSFLPRACVGDIAHRGELNAGTDIV